LSTEKGPRSPPEVGTEQSFLFQSLPFLNMGISHSFFLFPPYGAILPWMIRFSEMDIFFSLPIFQGQTTGLLVPSLSRPPDAPVLFFSPFLPELNAKTVRPASFHHPPPHVPTIRYAGRRFPSFFPTPFYSHCTIVARAWNSAVFFSLLQSQASRRKTDHPPAMSFSFSFFSACSWGPIEAPPPFSPHS